MPRSPPSAALYNPTTHFMGSVASFFINHISYETLIPCYSDALPKLNAMYVEHSSSPEQATHTFHSYREGGGSWLKCFKKKSIFEKSFKCGILVPPHQHRWATTGGGWKYTYERSLPTSLKEKKKRGRKKRRKKKT